MSDIQKLKLILDKVRRLDNYRPSKEVNKVFTSLVSLALESNENLKISDDEYRFIQTSASKAEYELEKYWTDKITKSNARIEDFPYYQNYIKLTGIEWSTLLSCKNHLTHNVLFVGSGPLPLTGIILARDYGCSVTLLDISKEAVAISSDLISSLELDQFIKVVNGDALTFTKYRDYDVIYLAALAGIEDGLKKKIMSKIRNDSRDDVHIIARSSFGNREILYKPLKTSDIEGFKLEVEVKPHNDIVNSFLIMRK